MFNSLWPHGLQPTRLLCLWGYSRQEYWSGLPWPPPGDLPSPGIKPSSPTLKADSLPTEPQGNPFPHIHSITHEDLLITSSWVIQAEPLNQKNFLKIGYLGIWKWSSYHSLPLERVSHQMDMIRQLQINKQINDRNRHTSELTL